jgi:hypothetical protein
LTLAEKIILCMDFCSKLHHVNIMAHVKPILPEKDCAHCGRVMVWRKAWAKNWEDVKYCSQRCRREAKSNKPADQSRK